MLILKFLGKTFDFLNVEKNRELPPIPRQPLMVQRGPEPAAPRNSDGKFNVSISLAQIFIWKK